MRILYVSHDGTRPTERGKRSHYHINHESHKHEMKGTFDDDVDDHACDDPREGKHNTAIKQKLKVLTFYKQVIRN